MSKKNVLWGSSVYVIYFIIIAIVSFFCESDVCRIHDDDVLGQVLLNFISLIPVFIFSLITYKMRDEVFQAWWKFARWFVPVIIFVTWFINSQSGGSGMAGAIGKGFDMFILGIFYVIFVIISLIKIILAYKQAK